MKIEAVTLTGRIVRLEPLDARHAADLDEAATPEIFAYSAPPPEFSAAGFAQMIAQKQAMPDRQAFAVVLLSSGKAIGSTSYMDIRLHDRALEIGSTWIAEPYQGTGVNPEMKYLMLQHAFEDQAALRVQLKTDSRNLQSQRAITKLGAKYEGTLRKHMIMYDGYQRDTVMFSIIDTEWPAVKAGLEARLAQYR